MRHSAVSPVSGCAQRAASATSPSTSGSQDRIRASQALHLQKGICCSDLSKESGLLLVGKHEVLNASRDSRDHVPSPIRACWHFGQAQTWRRQHFLSSSQIPVLPGPAEQFELAGGQEVTRAEHTVVWLMASASYASTLGRLLGSLEAAGEPCVVRVRWVPDLKDTSKEGFILMGEASPSYRVFYFNYVKFLFIFEALLEAVLLETVPMVVVMDLDVQVFPGWVQALRRCLEDEKTGADVCFLQQAAFGDRRLQQANSGVLVFGICHEKLGRFGAFLGALVARLQAQELLAQLLPTSEPVAFEQLHMNYVLNHIRTHVETSRVEAVRWGIYSPLVAYAGMFLTHAVLSDTVHHATASNVHLKSKIRFMDASKLLVQDLKEFCPLNPEGQQLIVGPLKEFCFYFTGEDPHFGPLLPHHKLFAGFSEADNEKVIKHLITRQGKKFPPS